jgi:single-stranded-DNA-specific exonuclease
MKDWIVKEDPDISLVQKIEQGLDLPSKAAKILALRGFELEGARKFLNPSIKDLHDPFLLKGMDIAVDRIILGIQNQEKIVIYGDYDVDGTTGTALLLRVIKSLGGNCDYYLPHRLHEGYGLSSEGVQQVHERGANLIITVDCGTTAFDEVVLANKLGMDVIVTDHHELSSGADKTPLPPAVSVINPKHAEDQYPYKDLSGCGLAYKLAEGLFLKAEREPRDLYYHLDLVALATVADIVPLTGENRVFTKFGIKSLEKTRKPGLRALLSVSGIDRKEINAYHIGFVIGPRINAMGRLASAQESVRLLMTEDEEEGLQLAKELDKENRLRREVEEKILEEALVLMNEIDLSGKKGIVLAQEGWHEGVIGIVASRLVDKFHRPTILISLEDHRGKGSGRSIPGFHLFNALQKCGDDLISFGGHKGACGLNLKLDQLEGFRKRFEEVANKEISEDSLRPKIFIDSEIEISEIDHTLMQALKLMEPFGLRNPRPLFVLRNVEVVGHPRIVGDGHIKFRIRENARVLTVMGFGLGDFLPQIQHRKQRLSVVFSINEDEFLRERREEPSQIPLLLQAKDLRIEEDRK